jgi:hypothetical protein
VFSEKICHLNFVIIYLIFEYLGHLKFSGICAVSESTLGISDRQPNDGEHGDLADVRTQPRTVPRKVGTRRVHSGTQY